MPGMLKIAEESREDTVSDRENRTREGQTPTKSELKGFQNTGVSDNNLLQMQEVSVLDIANRESMDLDRDSVEATRRTPVQGFGSTEEDLPDKPPETANNTINEEDVLEEVESKGD